MKSRLISGDVQNILTPSLTDMLAESVQKIAGQARLGVAVSGGADSFAALDILRRYFPPAQLICLTVDHGLRAGSAREADIVASWCRDNRIHHETLIWLAAEKPSNGVQAAARKARYRLLATACHQHRVRFLVTAHQADDQAETLMMRLGRGAGIEGMSGIAPVSRIAAGALSPVTLLRPFLGVSRAAFQAYAGMRGLPVQTDPGNQDMAYERVRIRQSRVAVRANDEALSLKISTRALCRIAASQLEAREDLMAQCLADFNAARGVLGAMGAACLDLEALGTLPASRQMRLLRRLCHAVSGRAQPPAHNQVVDLLAFLGERDCTSLGGALFWRQISAGNAGCSADPQPVAKPCTKFCAKSGTKLWILREPAALLGRAGVAPINGMPLGREHPLLWDNRFIIRRGPDRPAGKPDGPAGKPDRPSGKPDCAAGKYAAVNDISRRKVDAGDYRIHPLGRYFGTHFGAEERGDHAGIGERLQMRVMPATMRRSLAFSLAATLPAGYQGAVCRAIPLCAKNSVIIPGGPWRCSLGVLHVEVIINERFFRPVNRF